MARACHGQCRGARGGRPRIACSNAAFRKDNITTVLAQAENVEATWPSSSSFYHQLAEVLALLKAGALEAATRARSRRLQQA